MPSTRCFNIMQYEYHPFDAYDEDGNLLPDAKPLITQKNIDSALAHRSIKEWAYCWHDKDAYTEEDELEGITGQRVAGDKKPRHVHIVGRSNDAIELDVLARWFGIQPQYIEMPKGHGKFLDCVEYLTHEHPKQRALGKYPYPDDAVVANFDWRARLDERNANREKYGRNADNMSASDAMLMHVLRDGWTLRQAEEDDPLTYSKVRSRLFGLRLDYLKKQPAPPLRINWYIDGKSGVGKTSVSDYLGQALFPEHPQPVFHVGTDKRVRYEGYDGEPVMVWDDMRAEDFITGFDRRGAAFEVLDTHPKVQAHQIKGSSVILTNSVNIINGVQPYEEFLEKLALAYRDTEGYYHESEVQEIDQVYRRFPMIICLHDSDFDVLFNQGFIDPSNYGYRQYVEYAHVQASMKRLMNALDGKAKERVLVDVTRPILECHEAIVRSHDEKITDPDLIPEEFRDIKIYKGAELQQYNLINSIEDFTATMRQRTETFLSFVGKYCDWLDGGLLEAKAQGHDALMEWIDSASSRAANALRTYPEYRAIKNDVEMFGTAAIERAVRDELTARIDNHTTLYIEQRDDGQVDVGDEAYQGEFDPRFTSSAGAESDA